VPELRSNYALTAKFQADAASPGLIEQKMEESKQKRRRSQPVAASAGCIFKNPEEIPAGMLVDELGLKEASVGKAQVSTEHGNFIVNRGKANTADVLGLIDRIRREAKSQRNITLETEVQIIGEDEFAF